VAFSLRQDKVVETLSSFLVLLQLVVGKFLESERETRQLYPTTLQQREGTKV